MLVIRLNKGTNVVRDFSMFSWTEAQDFKQDCRRLYTAGDTMTPASIRELGGIIDGKFVRKHFRDFDYLTVSVTPGAMMADTIIAALGLLGAITLITLVELRRSGVI